MSLGLDRPRIPRLPGVGLGILAALAVASVATAAVVEVTSCGQTVPQGRMGVLVADLDCSALPYGSYAVVLSKGARLRLEGFTILSAANGVRCVGRCRITGAGTIARTAPSCSGGVGIDTYGVLAEGPVTLKEITFTGFGYATWTIAPLRAVGVVVSGECTGLAGNLAPLSVRRSTITDNQGYGVAGVGAVSVVESTVTGNPIDIVSYDKKPRVRRTTCDSSFGGPLAAPDAWGVCSAP